MTPVPSALSIRKAADRGRTRTGWLDSAHTFSFGGYRDPAHMGFRALRVLNEDRVAPGGGFGPHSHAEMEILTYVVEGALAHRDSTGTEGVIRAGDVQRMTAGSGIVHSERNASDTDPVRFLQIWLLPAREGLAPGYAQRGTGEAGAGLVRLADRAGRDGALCVHADAALSLARLDAGERLALPLDAGRHGWLQLVRGALRADGTGLEAGDGAAVSDAEALLVEAREPSLLLWFELG